MSTMSSPQILHSSSSSSGMGSKAPVAKIAVGYVKCSVCGTVTARESVDFRLRCNDCASGRCDRCRGVLDDHGDCQRCLEVEVATDAEVYQRRSEGRADALGNPTRRPIETEDDEYNAYSAGVYEYNVTDDEIATIRDRDSRNEWLREMRATVNRNGTCPLCRLELSVAEQERGVCSDCWENDERFDGCGHDDRDHR